MCFIYHHISYHTSSYIIICLHALAEKNLSSSWAMWNWSYFSARWNSMFLIFSRMDRRYLKRICLPLSTNATIQYPLFFFSFWSLKVPVDLSKAACSLIHLGYLHCTELHVFLLIHLCFFPHISSFFLLWSQAVLLWQEEKIYYCSLAVLEFWKITYNFCCDKMLHELCSHRPFLFHEDYWKKQTT